MSRWSAGVLTPHQITYAALDSYMGLQVYLRLVRCDDIVVIRTLDDIYNGMHVLIRNAGKQIAKGKIVLPIPTRMRVS